MNRKEAERQNRQEAVLMGLGFTGEEAEKLRRISMTLHRWHENECGTDNGCIERDEATGVPYWHNADTGRRWRIADREKGALKRLAAIIEARNERDEGGAVASYVQGDPRGAALYIIRPGDVPAGEDVAAYYSRGVVVY